MLATSRFWHFSAATFLSCCTLSALAQGILPPSPSERVQLTTQINAQLIVAAKNDHNLAILQGILNQPEDSIDLAKAEVTIEKMIDPTVNEADTLKQLDALAATVRARFPQGDTTDNEIKAGILISTLNDAGPWNGNRPYHYDLDNPLGNAPRDKLLSNYLASRKGNCVSMPVLFVIIGQKLGMPVTLSTAPLHDFAKFKRDNGAWMNIEVTSYGTISDEHYQQQMDITPRALATGIYLQTLTRKESVLVLMDTLMQFYRHHRPADQQLAMTTLAIMTSTKDVQAWLWRGDAYGQMADERFLNKYGSAENIPPAMRNDYMALNENNLLAFQKAEELGWVEETPKHKADYLQSIQKVKATKQGS